MREASLSSCTFSSEAAFANVNASKHPKMNKNVNLLPFIMWVHILKIFELKSKMKKVDQSKLEF